MKLNLRDLELACKIKQKSIRKWIPYNEEGRYWFKDNGSNILAVAHLDSVQEYTHFHEMKLPHKHWVFSPTLDDRLGVYIIYFVLPILRLNYDILFTTDEEIGRSTASNFKTDKQYNWIFEFDRKGDDMVMYDYETKELVENIEKTGWKVGRGSYTDICELQHLNCKGFNFGTGYQDYHSKDAYVDMKVLITNIQKFFIFYQKFKDIHLPHEKKERRKYTSWRSTKNDYHYGYGYGSYYGYGDYEDYESYGTQTKTEKTEDYDKSLVTGCVACGGTGKNTKGGRCIPCNGDGWVFKNDKKKVATSSSKIITVSKVPEKKTLPTHLDMYSYACTDCGSYNEIDTDTCDELSMEAAELNICPKCYKNKTYFT